MLRHQRHRTVSCTFLRSSASFASNCVASLRSYSISSRALVSANVLGFTCIA